MTHTIERLFVEVNTTSMSTAYGVRDEIDQFIQDKLLPLLESQLADYANHEQEIQLNLDALTLEIDVQQKDWKFELQQKWEAQIALEVLPKLEEARAESLKNSANDQSADPFIYFLDQGLFPWWFESPKGEKAMDAWLYQKLEDAKVLSRTIEKITRTAPRTRAIKQLKNGFLFTLINSTQKGPTYWDSNKRELWETLMKRESTATRNLIWELLLSLYLPSVQLDERNTSLIAKWIQENIKPNVSKSPLSQSEFTDLLSQSPNNALAKKLFETLPANLGRDLATTSTKKPSVNSETDSTTQKSLKPIELGDDNVQSQDISNSSSVENREHLNTDSPLEKVESLDADASKQTQPESKEQLGITKPESIPSDEEIEAKSSSFNKQNELEQVKNNSKIEANLENKTATTDDLKAIPKRQTGPDQSESFIKKETKIVGSDSESSGFESSTDSEIRNEQKSNKIETGLDQGFESKSTLNKSLYMPNCGFILIHPFLSAFLKNCELLSKNGQLKDKIKTAQLFFYTATGRTSAYEHELHFFKFLCDIPQGYSIDRAFDLSQELLDKSDELLEAVLGHLPQLGSSSIALLRNEFLCREGKLELGGTNKLLVSRKTQDLLLENLPWGLSVLKLPWLKKLTYIEW